MNIDPTFMAKINEVGLEPKKLIAGLQMQLAVYHQK